jgi:hypothetical protein
MSPDEYEDDGDEFYEDDLDRDDRSEFAEPGGNSSLYAASRRNPRIYSCPTCGRKNQLTPRDVAQHHQCNYCADAQERGF